MIICCDYFGFYTMTISVSHGKLYRTMIVDVLEIETANSIDCYPDSSHPYAPVHKKTFNTFKGSPFLIVSTFKSKLRS